MEEARLATAVTLTHKCLARLERVTVAATDHRVKVMRGGAEVMMKMRDSEAITVEGGATRSRLARGGGNGQAASSQRVGAEMDGLRPPRRRCLPMVGSTRALGG